MDQLIEGMNPVQDVYKILKTMYGRNHPRSVCFETDEAQTALAAEDMREDGGDGRNTHTYPCC